MVPTEEVIVGDSRSIPQRFPWELARVYQALEEILVKAYREVSTRAEQGKVLYRYAAFSIAVGRVAQALELQGLP